MKYIDYDGMGLAELIQKKEASPIELVEAAFAQVEKVNPAVNAVVRTRKEKALAEAKEVDLSKPFAGVPIMLKDIGQDIAGEVNSCGAKLMSGYVSKEDSNFTKKLREAGFIMIGQTNTPEFAFKNITDPEIFGETKNPWHLDYSAGGSSGGASASVAAGMVPISGASDGGGSIRIPASFTGLFGLKPTRGRTPVGPGSGRKWQGAAIDFVLSRSVRDSAALLDVLQVVEEAAAFQTPLFPDSYLRTLGNNQDKKYRIAYTTESPVGTPVSEEAKLATLNMAKWLESQGHTVEEKSNGVDGNVLMEGYFIMNGGETAAMFTRMEKALGREITSSDVELMTWAIYQMGKGITAAEYSNSLAEWDKAAEQMAIFHQTYDFYLTPATAHPAPKNDSLVLTDEVKERLEKTTEFSPLARQQLIWEMFEDSLALTPFTQLANLTGQPGISVPTHVTKEGLPLGVQFMADKGREDLLLQMAYQIEQSDQWIGMKGNPYFNF